MSARSSSRVPVASRVPPHDLEAEAAVLSACLLKMAALDTARGILRPEHFYSEAHRWIFAAAVDLRVNGKPVDVVQVGTWLKDQGRIAQVGGLSYISEVLNAAPAVAHVDAYARTVREKARLRQVIATCQRIAAEAYLDVGDVAEFIEAAEVAVREIAHSKQTTDRATWESLAAPVPGSWFTSTPPAREWLLRDKRRPKVDGVLPLGKVGGFIAPGGVGKTMALLQLAIAVAKGEPWLSVFDVPERGRTLLLLGEEDHAEIHRRVFNAGRGQTSPPVDALVALPLAGVPCALLERDANGNSIETAFLHWLRDYIVRAGPWKLVIVDPLSRFAGPDAEKDNAQGTRFVQALESITSLTGATVLFSHHTAKINGGEGGRGGRGSSSIFDGCRWEAAMEQQRIPIDDPDTRERLGELVTLSFTKSNYSRRADPTTLRRDEGGPLVLLDDVDLETVTRAKDTRGAKVQAKADEGLARVREDGARAAVVIASRSGLGVRELRDALRAAHGSCSNDRAGAALASLGAALVRVTGRRGAHHLHLDGARVPAEVLELIGASERPAVSAARPPSTLLETPS